MVKCSKRRCSRVTHQRGLYGNQMSDILKIRALLQRDDQLPYKVGLAIGHTINRKFDCNFVEGSGLVIYVLSVWIWYLLGDFEASDGGGRV